MKINLNIAAVVSCVMLMLAISPAHAATFGRTTAGTVASGGLRADFKRGSKFVLSEKGIPDQICAYLDGKGGGTGIQRVRFALYRDRNAVPGDIVTETGELNFDPTLQAGWFCASLSPIQLEPGAYWMIIHTGGDPGIARYYYDGAANWYGNADEYADGSADTFGVGSTGAGTLSIRVTYFTEAEMRIAGTATIGSRVSAPMSAQFKRGSSFELTEEAALVSMNVYLDGLGGATGSQPLVLALYDDINGQPGGLVAQGTTGFPNAPAGHKGRWLSAGPKLTAPLSLMPGRYWIVIQSGSPAGVYRYYMEGQGNWVGNASAGDTAPPYFGKANAGDGTISAYIVYSSSHVEHKTIGLTTPGTTPSKGLTANFMRGSLFGQDPFFYAQVTALWAYLDGNGGAQGSQKVRLALYENEGDDPDQSNFFLKVVSDEVTIPAGMPPGWVRFAVPYTDIFDYAHMIMLISSGPSGVVRSYSTTDSKDWYGIAADYSQGPPDGVFRDSNPEIPRPVLQQGTVTLSVYAEYLSIF
jgi:hypothetical protein